METEGCIRCGLLLLDPEPLADIHVVLHQLVGRVDNTPSYLILSPINLVRYSAYIKTFYVCVAF